MTNQLNFSPQEEISNWTKAWFLSKMLLVSLFTIMLFAVVIAVIPTVYVFGAGVAVLFLLAFFLLKTTRKPSVSVKVENQQLHYYCMVKKEKISIPVSEITKVTSQFCELQIHTSGRTYCLNLKGIRQEQQRWEIKEMIRKLVPYEPNAVVNF